MGFGLVLAAIWGGAAGFSPEAAASPPLRTSGGVVAADHEVASRVGAQVLERGGNAVDAAAATALALGVVNPTSSGLGGGGFAVVYLAAEKKTYVVDFREVAPAALTPDRFVREGKVDVRLARIGGLAVGVPGEAAGLHHLVSRYGRLSWRRAVAPALALAGEGFPVSQFLADRAAAEATARGALADLIRPGGEPLRAGQILRRPALARTLEALARKGPGGFYRGPVAADLVATVTGAGGVMTEADLAGYRVVERTPLVGRLGRYRIVTMPLPSSGGLVLLEALGILEALEPDAGGARPLPGLASLGLGSVAALHRVSEALEHAFADRARFLGDDRAAAHAGTELLDPARLRRLAARIGPRAGAHDRYGDVAVGGATAIPDDGGTSHLCVIDRDGNAVALTTTVNGYFGAKLVAGSGVVLNNEVDDFSLAAGTANMYGLIQSERNLVGPGKRPLSSMTPTLVFDGDRVVACAGGSGGPRIISNTLQVLLDVLVFGMDAGQAVAAPRIHNQWLPDRVLVENQLPDKVVEGLRRLGHTMYRSGQPTAVQLVVVEPDGTREAASDPRKGGAPAAEAVPAAETGAKNPRATGSGAGRSIR